MTIPVSCDAHRKAEVVGMTLTAKTLTLRLIKVKLSSGGHVEVLATSLIDQQAFPASAFAELYHARWNIEEAFKVLKHRLYLEQFTGELPESIRQDIHAKIFTANLGGCPRMEFLKVCILYMLTKKIVTTIYSDLKLYFFILGHPPSRSFSS